MSIRAEIRQRPVGQGGLCEGWIRRSRLAFRWVHDCGSNQTTALTREINRIGGPIDLLFLSHLDNDHVNGVDALLAARQTDEVVLPYLNDDERIVLMAAAASSGALSGSFLAFARDPAAWLLDRGVARVTYIRGGDDGAEPDADAPDPDNPLSASPSTSTSADGSLKAGATRPRQSRPTAASASSNPARPSTCSPPGTSRSGRFCPKPIALRLSSSRPFGMN